MALGLSEEQVQQVLDGFGTIVPKSRLDDKIADRDTQLTELQTKAAGNKDLRTEITCLQQEFEKTKTDFEAQFTQKDYDFALMKALRTAKAKNPTAEKN